MKKISLFFGIILFFGFLAYSLIFLIATPLIMRIIVPTREVTKVNYDQFEYSVDTNSILYNLLSDSYIVHHSEFYHIQSPRISGIRGITLNNVPTHVIDSIFFNFSQKKYAEVFLVKYPGTPSLFKSLLKDTEQPYVLEFSQEIDSGPPLIEGFLILNPYEVYLLLKKHKIKTRVLDMPVINENIKRRWYFLDYPRRKHFGFIQ